MPRKKTTFFKMKGFSGFKQRDTTYTGGREEHLTHGGQVDPFWNPQYVPGHQIKSDTEEEYWNSRAKYQKEQILKKSTFKKK